MDIINENEIYNQELLQVCTEAYFGETEGIKELQRLISKIRKNTTVSNLIKINSSIAVSQFNREVEKVFGFKRFALNITVDIGYSAITIPVGNSLEVLKYKDKISTSKDFGFRFKESKYSVMTYISSGMILSKSFTDREILGIILHEIGHSFTSGYMNNALISKSLNIANYAYQITMALEKSILDGIDFEIFVSGEAGRIFSRTAAGSNLMVKIMSDLDNSVGLSKLKSIVLGAFNIKTTITTELKILNNLKNFMMIMSKEIKN